MLFMVSIDWRNELQSENCFYLGEKENKKGVKKYFVYLGSEDNAVTPSFEDVGEMRDHLAIRGTTQGHPWSISAVILIEEHKKIPREIGFIQQYESWKVDGGECGSTFEQI